MNPQRAAAINKLIEAVGEARERIVEVVAVDRVDAHAWPSTRPFCSESLVQLVDAYDQLMRAPLDDPGPPKTRTAAPLTSHWAARSIDNKTVSGRILRYLYMTEGRTVDEIEQALTMRHQSCSARINELRDCGWIYTTGETHPTRSGRLAEVYTLTERGKQLLMEVRYG